MPAPAPGCGGEHFGFIFQRYQLLPDLDAVGNVEVPAVYAGTGRGKRRRRAAELLTRLGLGDRLGHRPAQLSGGQQQRVSVARALINGGEVILADEPTGALDSRSGRELLDLLAELNAQGHTVIIVTHDPEVADAAGRIVEIRDGRILSDTVKPGRAGRIPAQTRPETAEPVGAGIGRAVDALRSALIALSRHRLRSFLTMLGIIIGIASVVSVVGLGTGSQQKVLETISSIGTNTITVRPGSGFGDRRAGAIDTLVVADADALAREDFAASVSPEISTAARASRGSVSTTVQVYGTGTDYFSVGAYKITAGRIFTADDLAARSQVAVLDDKAATTFFPDGSDPLGQILTLGRVPLRVIGVVQATGAGFGPSQVKVFAPFGTVAIRITGQDRVSAISVRVADDTEMKVAEAAIDAMMLARHGSRDFFLMNSDTIRETITSTARTLTWLVSAIALISLVVGGIGVMNIMLVSVTERTREIGVRIAVGARHSDIVHAVPDRGGAGLPDRRADRHRAGLRHRRGGGGDAGPDSGWCSRPRPSPRPSPRRRWSG